MAKHRVGIFWFLGILSLFDASGNAWAYESKLQIDPNQNLEELAASGTIKVSSRHDHGVYYADASAVLVGKDFQKLMNASIDFNHYGPAGDANPKGMGMPNVREAHIVSGAGTDLIYMWTYMSYAGQATKHYLEVRVDHDLTPSGAAATEWDLVHRQSTWPYTESTPLRRQDGSFYLEPLANGRIYVRYYLAGVVEIGLPDFLVENILKKQFSDGARKVIQVLASQAQSGNN